MTVADVLAMEREADFLHQGEAGQQVGREGGQKGGRESWYEKEGGREGGRGKGGLASDLSFILLPHPTRILPRWWWTSGVHKPSF